MSAFIKHFLFFSIALILSATINAQDDTSVYSPSDSLQDIQIKYLNRQIEALQTLLKQNINQQEYISDSLRTANQVQAALISKLSKESEALKEKLILAFEEIDSGKVLLTESKLIFKTIYFITVPVMILIILGTMTILLVLLSRHKNNTNEKISALRKYTYEGIEEVRTGYIDEIKRRVRKITARIQGKNKKGKNKKGKNKKDKNKKQKSTK